MYNSGNSSKNITGASIVDGTVETVDIADDAVTADKLSNSVNTDIATGVSGSTTAGDALPKAGGAMTGAITTNSTFDGVDVATRDGVLTTTTTTANAALPKAGGTMTGTIAGFTSTGIDDNATSRKLTVSNDGLTIYGANNSQLSLKGTDTAPTAIIFDYNSGGAVNRTRLYNNAGSFTFLTNNGEEKVRFQQNGGISFNGDSAAANALDDYEEGTWSGTFVSSTDSNNNVESAIDGYYTKIGNVVYINIKMGMVDLSGITSSDPLHLEGLPFVAGNQGSNVHFSLSVGSYRYLTPTTTTFIVIDNSDDIKATTDGFTSFKYSDLTYPSSTATYMNVSGTYQV
jgi:hypothetical protein